MIEKIISLLPHQRQALMSTKKKTMMLCGIGSGKSYLGAIWTVKKMQESPKSIGLISANSYSQLQKATLETCYKLYEDIGLNYKYNKQDHVLTLNNKKKFYCLSLDNYDLHRGIEIGEWWADELAYSKEDAYKVMIGRLRDKKGKLDCLFTTTPKGMNWLHDYFSAPGNMYDKDNTEIITAKTRDNTYLPEFYESDLRRDYGDTLSRQELDAEFIRIGSGLAYYAFNSEKVVKECNRIENNTVLIGLDFNVNPYCAVLCHFIDGTIYVFDEIYLENSNTPEMIRSIKSKIGDIRTQIYPDSTQFKRNTLGITDFEFLRKEFEIIQTHNPFVIDRANNLNRLFELGKVVISPRCRKLINDLNKVTWRDKNLELDQVTDKMLTHMSDGLGYLCWRILPFKKPSQISVSSYT